MTSRTAGTAPYSSVVTTHEIRGGLRRLGLSGRPVCVHASLSSFGWVEGGAAGVVQGLLEEGSTVMVPAFTFQFLVSPPVGMRWEQNAWDYNRTMVRHTPAAIYTSRYRGVDGAMGAVARALLARPEVQRGYHPLNSFAAVGPRAAELVEGQTAIEVYAPLEALSRLDGAVVLMGTGLQSMTALHYAEQRAGRNLFRRWALDHTGVTLEAAVGSCSMGFDNFEPALGPVRTETTVGRSRWRCYPAQTTIERATEAIRAFPDITLCGKSPCRCQESVRGGPILDQRG